MRGLQLFERAFGPQPPNGKNADARRQLLRGIQNMGGEDDGGSGFRAALQDGLYQPRRGGIQPR